MFCNQCPYTEKRDQKKHTRIHTCNPYMNIIGQTTESGPKALHILLNGSENQVKEQLGEIAVFVLPIRSLSPQKSLTRVKG